MQLLSEILLARENAELEPSRGRAVEEGPASGVPGAQPAAAGAEDFGAPAAFIDAAEAFLASGLPDAGEAPAPPPFPLLPAVLTGHVSSLSPY